MTKIDTDVVAAAVARMREVDWTDATGDCCSFWLASRIADAAWGPYSERSLATQAKVDRFYDLTDGIVTDNE